MERSHYLEEIDAQFQVHSVCALLGPRQVGKTTLSKMYTKQHPELQVFTFDLENPLDLLKLENPILTFSRISNALIIIDEIQKRRDLFPVLRVLVDEIENNRKFLVLGSASGELLRQSSETLAGRIGYIDVAPFSLEEVGHMESLFLRGGFPKSFLAPSEEASYLWRQAYIKTFLEKDVPNLGFQIPPEQIRRFWLMLAHWHGQLFSASELSKSLGVSDHTVRKYLDILVGTFMIRELSPWYENLSKRQVKSPKIYFKDSGILNALLGIRSFEEQQNYPKLGSFWEGFALEEVIKQFKSASNECFFWRTQAGAELDLLILKDGKRLGFEFKYSDAPRVTSSMRIAFSDLKLDHLYVIYPGKDEFPLDHHITAKALISKA